MDTPVIHAEHEEFRNTIKAEFERLSSEDNRQNHRLDALEESVKQISALATSTEKLTANMESMVKEQEKQGKRLETLESRDGELWRKIVGSIATTIVGIVVGFVFAQFGM